MAMTCGISWYSFPWEIRNMILQNLVEGNRKLCTLATVSREWQAVIEKHTFSRIRLTTTRLGNLAAMTRRNRSLVRHLCFDLELEPYDCTACAHEDETYADETYADETYADETYADETSDDETYQYSTTPGENLWIRWTFANLFYDLSAWGSHGAATPLTLDINIY
jgi:hypothetical protein